MKLTIFVLAAVFCMAHSNPVPLPEESIDLINIPLKDNKELDILTLAESDGSISERNKRTIGILRELFPQLSKVQAVEEQNYLEPSSAGSDAFLETIRVARETTNLNNNQDNKINNDQPAEATEPVKDQQAQAAENSSSAVDELTLDSVEDDENRGKRFLNFGAQASGSGSSGSGGGSGNFLFDIIRQTADRVGRGVGSTFRVLAGTESLDSAIKNINIDAHGDTLDDDSSLSRSARSGNFSSLVSGSSGSEQQDERANAPVDGSTDVGKGDGYTEGIPGPVTRLFVLANRGLSNLIQDLILRIAQTSERVVNFKARLITALI